MMIQLLPGGVLEVAAAIEAAGGRAIIAEVGVEGTRVEPRDERQTTTDEGHA